MDKNYGDLEQNLLLQNKVIAGVDEVGRGCLAGPVYAAAAVLDFDKLFALKKNQLSLIRDSKSLSHKQRAISLSFLPDIALSYGIAHADTWEIEELGISKATFLAMHRALNQLKVPFDILLLDGKYPLPDFEKKQMCIIGGDASCFSIAAASIFAKEARDGIMRDIAKTFPNYGFEKHVGYATKMHLSAIKQHGICSLHRKNFEPIKSMLSS